MLRRLCSPIIFVVFAVALLGDVDLARSGESGSPEAARQQFARNYIAAIGSRNPARLKALIHPQVLACRNFAEYFDLLRGQFFDDQPGPGYKVTFTALPNDTRVPFLPPDRFAFPVRPTYQLEISWARNADGSSGAILAQFIAEKGGAWFLVEPCPNDAGMKFAHEMIDAGRKQNERAQMLASQLKDPLKGELLVLLKQSRKMDAIKKYRSASGADLTTAVQVVDILGDSAR